MADPLAAAAPVVQGALTGAAPMIGTALGGFLGGPVGMALGGMAGKFIAEKISPEDQALKEQSKRDQAALKSGQLGFSEAEKRSMLAGTQRAIQAQAAGAESDLRRSAAAQGGFGRSGAQQAALMGLQAQKGEAAAKAAGNIDAQSQQAAERRFGDIMGRLGERRDEARATGAALGQSLAGTPASLGTAFKKAGTAQENKLADEAAGLLPAAGAAGSQETARLGGR